jgi:hypothetical protein
MQETRSLGSYSFYVEDETVDRIDEMDEYSRSKAAREAFSDWLDKIDGN